MPLVRQTVWPPTVSEPAVTVPITPVFAKALVEETLFEA